MCGFIISILDDQKTPTLKADKYTLSRGPDHYESKTFSIKDKTITCEFSHLYITQPETIQPLESDIYVLVINGEIYNYQDLSQRLDNPNSNINDSAIFFAHIIQYGIAKTIAITNGMFSGVLLNKYTGECQVFTDHVGKKPLLIWDSEAGWHIATGLDLNYHNKNNSVMHVIPPGINSFDYVSGLTTQIFRYTTPQLTPEKLTTRMYKAIAIRIPTQPFAVALSGGLDSAIIACILEQAHRHLAHYYVVGTCYPESVLTLLDHLNIEQHRVHLIQPPKANLLSLITETVQITKSANPSIISNGVATRLLVEKIHQDGIRVMLSGEGADEFFCGYQAMYNGKHDPEKMRTRLVKDLHFTELRRLDLISSHFAVEARCPFLDKQLTNYALSFSADSLCSKPDNKGKIILRDTFAHLLPSSITSAAKEPFDISSGLQKWIIDELRNIAPTEREALIQILSKNVTDSSIVSHPYFSCYPAFDTMIDKRHLKYRNNVKT